MSQSELDGFRSWLRWSLISKIWDGLSYETSTPSYYSVTRKQSNLILRKSLTFKCIQTWENLRRRFVGPNWPHRLEPRIFEWGFKRNWPKSWHWKQKQWKPIKGQSPAKNGLKFPFRVTILCPYKLGLEWTFEALPVPKIISWESSSCRKRTWVNCTSVGRAMAVQRGYPSNLSQNWGKSGKFCDNIFKRA